MILTNDLEGCVYSHPQGSYTVQMQDAEMWWFGWADLGYTKAPILSQEEPEHGVQQLVLVIPLVPFQSSEGDALSDPIGADPIDVNTDTTAATAATDAI